MSTYVASSSLPAAGSQLVKALSSNAEGFVTRITICPEQATYAQQLAQVRRVAAKRATGQGYAEAVAMPADADEQARLVADARGLLAEMVIGDILKAARADFKLQPFVSFTTEHDADLTIAGKTYDIKSSGQASPAWHHGVVKNCRLTDDRMFTIRGDDARHYASQQSAGYIGVYVYVRDDMPFACDVYYIAAASVEGQTERAATLADKSASWYAVPVAFPDRLVDADRPARLAVLARAGYCNDLPTMPKNAAAARAKAGAAMLAAARVLLPQLDRAADREYVSTYIKKALRTTSAADWLKRQPRYNAQYLFDILMDNCLH